MEFPKSLPAYKKIIKVIYSCETTEQLEVAKRLLQAYADLYVSNKSLKGQDRITSRERVWAASAIIKFKYRDLVD